MTATAATPATGDPEALALLAELERLDREALEAALAVMERESSPEALDALLAALEREDRKALDALLGGEGVQSR